MKGIIAFGLITLGTVGASLGVARTDPTVEGWAKAFQVDVPLTLVSLVVLAVGIALGHATRRKAAQSEGAGSLAAAREALASVGGAVDSLQGKLDSLDTGALHAEIDAIVSGPVTDFVENRNALTIAHGVGGYAAVMGPFAQGERYLNRAWSATTDGYRDEAVEYTRRAGPAIGEALDVLKRLSN